MIKETTKEMCKIKIYWSYQIPFHLFSQSTSQKRKKKPRTNSCAKSE